MIFSDPAFVFGFLPFCLMVCMLFPKEWDRRPLVLVLSLVFYAWWRWEYLPLFVASTVVNYLAANGLHRSLEPSRFRFLVLGVVGNVGLLVYFKYSVFTLGLIVGPDLAVAWLGNIILPLAISFYTFQQIAYLVDVYHGKPPCRSLVEHMLFVSFFPHLIAGPIVHHNQIIPQFRMPGAFKIASAGLSTGWFLFLIGLAKKVLIADNLATFVTPIFDAVSVGRTASFGESWYSAIAYTMQLYFDFSGYSDMAIGIALMLNIRLPWNFDSPYKSTSITIFWRRWHITLSSFLRDYLYIPLGGNRRGNFRKYANLLITMLLGGLWHGAGWTFLLWGAFHGVLLILHQAWMTFVPAERTVGWLRNIRSVSGWGLTFILTVFGWVVFRSSNLESSMSMLSSMVGMNGWTISPEIIPVNRKFILAACIIAWCLPNTQWFERRFRSVDSVAPFRSQYLEKVVFGMYAGILGALTLKTVLDAAPSEFLYFNF